MELLFLVPWSPGQSCGRMPRIRSSQPGGEKFMEIAFLNAILNSQHFPPLDPWLSGFAISYYYFGYVMMAVLTRLSGAVSGVALTCTMRCSLPSP